MMQPQTQSRYDFPRGVIIGPMLVAGEIFYDGRSQTGRFYASNDVELRALAKSKFAQLLKEVGEREVAYLWPDRQKWELRIYD